MLVLKIIIIVIHLALITLMTLPFLSQKINLWWLDNLVNLQLQWSILAIIFMLISFKYLQTYTIHLTILGFFYFLIIVYNFSFLYDVANIKQNSKEILKIAQLNIRYGNPNIDELIYKIGQSDYDIILLQEIGDEAHDKITKLSKYYPYSVGLSYSENFPSGMALFSRWPIVNKNIHDLGYIEGHIIEAIIQSPKNTVPLHVFTLHPGAPRNKILWQLRNSTLNYLGQLVSSSRLPYKIIIGDLNISPWSPTFQKLIKTAALKNSADGFGYIPSWAYSSINKLSKIFSSAYIDHCLTSHSFNIISKQYQQINGSDHVLISTKLGFN